VDWNHGTDVLTQSDGLSGDYINKFGDSGFVVRGGGLRGRDATISGMQDPELYRRILGIEAPWYVDSVELKLEVGEIHVRLATPRHGGQAVRSSTGPSTGSSNDLM
jgi:hypothetical protein